MTVLDCLVTSRARRQLLRLLWFDRVEGAVSELARRARVDFAQAHRELVRLRQCDLVRCRRSGRSLVYSANPEHHDAALMEKLVGAADAPPVRPTRDTENVRGWLAQAGAPLLVSGPPTVSAPPLEEVVAEGLVLAHESPTVAVVLPVLLWQRRQDLDMPALVEAASRRNERHALGFFLVLTGQLAGDRRLAALGRGLRDGRRRRPQPFFRSTRTPLALQLARERTPALARRWGYLMNTDMEDFASTFAKHTR